MRRYETIFISHPDLTEESLEDLTQQKTDVIEKAHGELIQIDQWGKKRLAYRVRKNSHGYYTLLDYAALPEAVRELERVLRLDDKVMKYLTVKLDDDVDLEAARKSVQIKEKPPEPPEVEAVEVAAVGEGVDQLVAEKPEEAKAQLIEEQPGEAVAEQPEEAEAQVIEEQPQEAEALALEEQPEEGEVQAEVQDKEEIEDQPKAEEGEAKTAVEEAPVVEDRAVAEEKKEKEDEETGAEGGKKKAVKKKTTKKS